MLAWVCQKPLQAPASAPCAWCLRIEVRKAKMFQAHQRIYQAPGASLAAETIEVQAPVSAPHPDINRGNKAQSYPGARQACPRSAGSALSAPPGGSEP